MRASVLVCVAALALASATVPGGHGQNPKQQKIADLIKQLGHDDFTTREKAARALDAIGEPALDALGAALASDDAEIRARAARLIDTIESRLSYFFNGKNLNGWQGLGKYWSVQKGAIVGATQDTLKFNTFLCTKKKYTDFELKFQVWLTAPGWPGNSGVQIRSMIVDPAKFIVMGPQCDIGAGYWGDLHGELCGGTMKQAPLQVGSKVAKENEFNDYFIRCVGQNVTIRINGVTTVDAVFAQLPAEGIIGWQLHGGGPMTVTFRNIEFKDLTAK
jgi:hypothetical protein